MDQYFKKKEIMANSNNRSRSADVGERRTEEKIVDPIPVIECSAPEIKCSAPEIKRCKLVKNTDLDAFKTDIKKELSSVNSVLEYLKTNVEMSENLKSLNEKFKKSEEFSFKNQNENNEKIKSLENQLKVIQDMIE